MSAFVTKIQLEIHGNKVLIFRDMKTDVCLYTHARHSLVTTRQDLT